MNEQAAGLQQFLKKNLLAVILGIVVVVLLIERLTTGGSSTSNNDGIDQVVSRVDSEQQQKAMDLDFARATAKSELESLLANGSRIEGLINSLQDEVYKWSAMKNSLLTSDLGRRIAANEPSLIAFDKLNDVKRPSANQIASFQSRLETLMNPIRKSLSNPAKPSSSIKETLSSLEQEVFELLSVVQKDARTLKAMTTSGAKPDKSVPALRVALETMHKTNEQEAIAQTAAATEKARIEANKQLADLEAFKVKAEKENELILAKNETERLLAIAYMKEQQFLASPADEEAYNDPNHPAWLKAKQETTPSRIMWFNLLRGSLEAGIEPGQKGELLLHHHLSHVSSPPAITSKEWLEWLEDEGPKLKFVYQYFPQAFAKKHEFPSLGIKRYGYYGWEPVSISKLNAAGYFRKEYSPEVLAKYGF